MKSKTSCFNTTIFKKNFTHFWPIWSIILGLQLFMVPFMLYAHYCKLNATSGWQAKDIMMQKSVYMADVVSCLISPTFWFFSSVIVVMAVFHYLFQSRSAYMMHAFPVTRKQLFLTNTLSGLLMLWIPALISGIFAILVAAGCGYTELDMLFRAILYALGISFALYSICVFVAMLTGQLAAVAVFSVVFNFLYYAIKCMVFEYMHLIGYGLPGNIQNMKVDVFSPWIYMESHVEVKREYTELGVRVLGLEGGNVALGYALAGCLFFVAAYMIYKRRQIETASSLIAIEGLKPLFRWGVSLFFGIAGVLITGAVFTGQGPKSIFIICFVADIIFAVVAFFVTEMLIRKEFMVFHKKRIIECCFVVLVTVAGMMLTEWDVLGIEEKLPDRSEVAVAFISGNSVYGGMDADQIDTILDIHRTAILEKKDYENYQQNAKDKKLYTLDITYYLKNGDRLQRKYEVPYEKSYRNRADSVASQYFEMAIANKNYLQSELLVNYDQLELFDGYIDTFDPNSPEIYGNTVLSREQCKQLYDAYLLDIKEGNHIERTDYMLFGEDEEAYTKINYYNTITINFKSKEHPVYMYEMYNEGDGYDFDTDAGKYVYDTRQAMNPLNGSICINYDKNFKHLVGALIETGVIEGQDDLTYMKEVNEYQNKQNNEEVEEITY